MSFSRSLIRQPTTLSRSARFTPAASTSARTFTSSGARRAAAGHDAHHDDHHGAPANDDTVTHESWFSPAWRNTFIFVALGFAVYPFMPEPNNEPQNPAADPEGWKRYLEDPKTPWITKYMGSFYTDPAEKRELVREHVNMRMKAAEDKLLYQDAEKPEVQRIRNRGALDQASPFGVPVGSNVNTRDGSIQ